MANCCGFSPCCYPCPSCCCNRCYSCFCFGGCCCGNGCGCNCGGSSARPNVSPSCDQSCDCGSVCGGSSAVGCCEGFPGERESWRYSPGPQFIPASQAKYRCTPPREFAVALPRDSRCPSCCCL